MVQGVNRFDFVTRFRNLEERVKRLEIDPPSKHGNTHVAGGSDPLVAADLSDYSPTLLNAGSATYAFNNGWWTYISPGIVYFSASLKIAIAGSGATAISLSLPVMPLRNPAYIVRPVLPLHVGDGGDFQYNGTGIILATGGTDGLYVDRLRWNHDTGATPGAQWINMIGSDLGTTLQMDMSGIYISSDANLQEL